MTIYIGSNQWAFDQIRQMHNLILANIQSLFYTVWNPRAITSLQNKTSILFLFENIVKKSKTFQWSRLV